MEGPEEELELDLRESRESLLHCVQLMGMMTGEFKRITEDCLRKGVLKNGDNYYHGLIPELKEYADWVRELALHSKTYIDWMEKYGVSIVRGRKDAIDLFDAAKKYHDEVIQKKVFSEPLVNDLLTKAVTLYIKSNNFPGMYEVSPRKAALDGHVAGAVWRHNGVEVDCGISLSVMDVMVEAARKGPGAKVEIDFDQPKNVQTDIRKAHERIENATGKKLDWHVKAFLKNGSSAVTVHLGPFPPKKSKNQSNSQSTESSTPRTMNESDSEVSENE